MKITIYLFVLLLITITSAIPKPDNYDGIPFFSKSKKLISYLSENINTIEYTKKYLETSSNIEVFELKRIRKGLIKTNLYFINDSLIMVREIYGNGKKVFKKRAKILSNKHGQLIGKGNTAWRQFDKFKIIIHYNSDSKLTKIDYGPSINMNIMLKEMNRKKSSKEIKINKELKQVKKELDSLK